MTGGIPDLEAATCRELASIRPQLDADQLFGANSKAFEAFRRAKGGDWTLGRISGEQLGLKVWHTALEACAVAACRRHRSCLVEVTRN